MSFTQILHDFLEAFFHAEHGFLHTVKRLTLHPGQMIRSYLDGQRVGYVSAAKYTIFIMFLSAIVFSTIGHHFHWEHTLYKKLHELEAQIASGAVQQKDPGEKVDLGRILKIEYLKKEAAYKFSAGDNVRVIPDKRMFDFLRMTLPIFESTLFKFLKITLLLWIPLMSLLTWVAFRSWRWNLAEHFTAQSYLFAHTILIFTVFSIPHWFFPNHNSDVMTTAGLVSLAYYAFAFMRLVPARMFRTTLKLGMTLAFAGFVFLLMISASGAFATIKAVQEAVALPF